MPSNQIPYTVRFTPAELALVRQRHQETYPAHGLSLNAWLVRRLVRPLRRRPAPKAP